jgi:outer membrane protein OmpA-like peptidoglycan-associated protein
MLEAIFDAGDVLKKDEEALRKAAALSALVYNEKDGAYWFKYFRVTNQADKKGQMVELGGSAVNNLADNLQLFGMVPGSTNIFAATYTVFAEIVKSQYPKLMPAYYPVADILDTSFVKEIAGGGQKASAAQADLATFTGERVKQVVSRRSWDIKFASGSNKFLPEAQTQLRAMFKDLVVASGTVVEVHGHTDNVGSVDKNQKLSESRAFAVKKWLEEQSSANFPEGRVKVFAHGSAEPIEANDTAEGRAKNRRVEIVLGLSQ